MGDFRLNTSVGVTYDEAKDSYVFSHFDENAMKKVTSRAFSCLLGDNHFESVGKTILERFKLTISEKIDEYYSVRGDMAELLVYDFLKDTYKQQGIELVLKTWTKEEVSYDNFKSSEKFGGLLDIAISSPEQFRAVVEVKSKSMKDYDKISKSHGNIEEVLQGKFLAKLSNVDKCLMVYVFFTPEQEKTIKDFIVEKNANKQTYPGMNFAKMLISKMGMSYKSVKISVFKHMIEAPKKFENDMEKAYKVLIDFKKTKTIHSSLFGANDISYLKGLTNQDTNPF